jgi:phage terminase small subunit
MNWSGILTLTNPRHERYAQELATGKTADEAYKSAGYKANRGNATRLKANDSIMKRIVELQGVSAEQFELTRASILQMLIDDRRAAGRLGQTSAAIRAAELLGKELGMFVERLQVADATYAISDKPMSVAAWREKYTKPTAH